MWTDDLVTIVRVLIDDFDPASYTYTDSRIRQVIVVGAQLVAGEVPLAHNYTIDVTNVVISPDPCLTATRDDAFINLVTLRSACLFDTGKLRTDGGRAIKIKDGPSEIDLTKVADSLRTLIEKGACALYQEARLDLQLGAVPGESILGPMKSPNFLYLMQGGGFASMRDRIFY